LAVDLLEALGQTDAMSDVLEQSVVVAGERRGALLRELMDAAYADGRHADVIRFGRSLLALGDELPPQVFLDMGEAAIKEGQVSLAARVFDRASMAGDFSTIQQRVASAYEEADLPASASRIIRELLIAEPDNVELLVRSGGLAEQLGQFDRAFEQHDRAVDLMLRRLPGVIRTDDAAAGAVDSDANDPRRRQWRAANLDEVAQFFDSAGNGLLNSARTEALQDRLLDTLREWVGRELDTLEANRSLATSVAGNPRLNQLASFVRLVAFALHAPDVADALDRRLLELYPQDESLRTAVLTARIDWGLHARALALTDTSSPDVVLPPGLLAATLASNSAQLEQALSKAPLDAATGRRLVPLLIMTGRNDDARRAIRAVEIGPAPDAADTAATMIVAGIALADPEAVRLWMDKWLEVCRGMDHDKVAPELERCLRLVWNHLRAEDRTALRNRIDRMAADLDGEGRFRVDLLRARLAEGTGEPFPDLDRVLQEAAGDDTLSADMLSRLLEQAPAEKRPGMLRAMADAREPTAVRSFLMELAGALTCSTDNSFIETFESLMRAAPRGRLTPDGAYSLLNRARWNRNRRQPELIRRIGELLLSESPNAPPILVTVATARQNAGAHDEAVLLVGEVLDTLLAVQVPQYQERRMLGDLIELLTPAEIDEFLLDVNDRIDIEGPTPTLLFAKGQLLDAADRPDEACDAVTVAFEMASGNRVFSRSLISILDENGQEVRLSRLLARYLTRSTIMESYEWRRLQRAYVSLHDPVRAAEAGRKNQSPLAPVDAMYVARMTGADERVRTTLRRFLITNRNKGRFFSSYWPEDPEASGMASYLADEQVDRRNRPNLFQALAGLDFAEPEYVGLLRAAPPWRRDAEGLIRGLAEASRHNDHCDRRFAELLDIQQRGALSAKDRGLILALAAPDAAAVPDALIRELDATLMQCDPTDVATLTALAQAARDRGDAGRAGHIWHWIVANDLLSGHSVSRLQDSLQHMDEYLATLPEEERTPTRRALSAWLAPAPLDRPTDALEAARLERWADLDDPAELQRRVAEARELVPADPEDGRFPMLAAAIAKHDAAAGRFDEFVTMAARAAGSQQMVLLSSRLIDCRKVLPPVGELDDPQRYVDAVAQLIEQRRDAGSLRRADATRSTCLLGRWCAQNGLADSAMSLLRQAEQQAGPLGEHWLWLSDLAELAGADDKVIEIGIRLLEADLLPVMRVPPLLDLVEKQRGRATADTLAVHVAAYSDHPDVLRRAIRRAEDRNDTTAASAYRQRIQSTSRVEE
ncbi:MAG TPA: hypothetical protein VM243_10340, partial [Phycisphaerae bacterium]|nr:hypothetical protein [Phycisphaerae bacterium]